MSYHGDVLCDRLVNGRGEGDLSLTSLRDDGALYVVDAHIILRAEHDAAWIVSGLICKEGDWQVQTTLVHHHAYGGETGKVQSILNLYHN